MVKAMVLAAGRGERLRPLTDVTPKPMIEVGGKPIIRWQLEALARAGFRDIVINVAWLGSRIVDALGEDAGLGLRIQYSDEGATGLETGGGIRRALPLLGEAPFVVVNGDIHTDYDYREMRVRAERLDAELDAHLVLVPNPPGKQQGDFALRGEQVVDEPEFTFSGIGIYRPRLIEPVERDKFPLAPLLREAMQRRAVSGEFWDGHWVDCGSHEQLAMLDRHLAG